MCAGFVTQSVFGGGDMRLNNIFLLLLMPLNLISLSTQPYSLCGLTNDNVKHLQFQKTRPGPLAPPPGKILELLCKQEPRSCICWEISGISWHLSGSRISAVFTSYVVQSSPSFLLSRCQIFVFVAVSMVHYSEQSFTVSVFCEFVSCLSCDGDFFFLSSKVEFLRRGKHQQRPQLGAGSAR